MKSRVARILLLATTVTLTACSRPHPNMTIKGAYWKDEVRSLMLEPYRVKPGYKFLVVDADTNFEQDTTFSTEDISLVASDGKLYPASGMRAERSSSYVMGKTYSTGTKHSDSFVFALPAETTNQTFALQYKNTSPLPFSVSNENK